MGDRLIKVIYLLIACLTLNFIFGVSFLVSNYNSNYDNHLTQTEYYNTKIADNVNLVIYKKDCPYCKAGKQAVIKEAKKSKITTYYIDGGTKQGLKIARKYKVNFAPTIVTIRSGKVKTYVYAKDKGKKIVPDEQEIQEAFKE